MELYKKILLTLDLSPVDEPIIEHVCRLAKIHGSRVYLLHVIHSHTLDQNSYLMNAATNYLKQKTDYFKNEGITVHSVIRSGEPEKEIINEIESNDYDLVAMGTHGHKLFLDILYGSVSESLKHKINIPLLLIRG